MRRFVLAAAFVALAIGPLAAQTPPTKPAPAPQATPAPAAEPPPPYEPQLLRLAELMGALSYLRDLCHGGDGGDFHDKMARLLDAEARTPTRKEMLAGAYNKGFGDYQLTYRACTTSAREIIGRYLDESARIARDIAGRYGG